MAENKAALGDELLDQVTGGFFNWSRSTMTMTYTHKNGSETKHKVRDIDKAWERSNLLHSQKIDEDKILQDLIDHKYIEG